MVESVRCVGLVVQIMQKERKAMRLVNNLQFYSI